jgi:ABC-type dipeptide/oligopeptide/nickel transport system ATPase component
MPHPATMKTPRGGTVVRLVNQYPRNGDLVVRRTEKREKNHADSGNDAHSGELVDILILVELWNEVLRVSNFPYQLSGRGRQQRFRQI